jgi:hypothetical protein
MADVSIDDLLDKWARTLAGTAAASVGLPDPYAEMRRVAARLCFSLGLQLAPPRPLNHRPVPGLWAPRAHPGMMRDFIRLACTEACRRLGRHDGLDGTGFLRAATAVEWFQDFAFARVSSPVNT